MDNQKWSLGFISLAFLFFISSSAESLIQQVTAGRRTEYNNRSYNLKANDLVTRVLREERPSSKIVTITSFSVMYDRREPYVSSVFEAAGYKWRLVLFLNGNPKDGGDGHISMYVRIEETGFPQGWEVNVNLELFVHNLKQHKYLTVTDGTVKRFTDAKKELGIGQVIPFSTFSNTNEGYIEQNTASFGAEISIIKPAEKQEKLTLITNPPNNILTWKILHFSTLQDKILRL